MDLTSLSDKDLNELAKGNLAGMSDAGFATLVKAREASTPMADKVARTRQRVAEQVNPTNDMSTGQRLAAGAGLAVTDMGRALQQVTGRIGRQDVDAQRKLDSPLLNTTAGKVGYAGGVGAVGAPLMLVPFANTVVGASVAGGALGGLSPVGEDDSVLRNVGIGALGGGGTSLALNRASAAIAPQVSPSVRGLLGEGVPLTPGQQLGGTFRRIEEGATSIPVTGDAIRNSMLRSVQGFNEAVANRALKPIGNKLPKGVTGRDAVDYTEKAIGSVYESALKRTGSVKADQPLAAEIASLSAMVRGSPMPAEVKAQFDSVLENQLRGKLQGQSAMTAQTFKEADSEIGRLAAKYAGDASVDKQLLGDALEETQAIMRRWLQRAAPKDAADDVKAANAGWAEFKRMQRAASALGSRDGVFSPEQYLSAVRALDKSKDKGAFARGEALGQDIGEAAVSVLGRTVPDSGTPFRTMVNEPVKGLLSTAATGPAALAYSSPRTMALAQMLLSGKRPALATKAAAELEMLSPLLTQLGVTGSTANERLRPR